MSAVAGVPLLPLRREAGQLPLLQRHRLQPEGDDTIIKNRLIMVIMV